MADLKEQKFLKQNVRNVTLSPTVIHINKVPTYLEL